MNALTLLNKLIDLQNEGHDLEKIEVNYRQDYNSDVVAIEDLEEDLFDEQTNSILESVVLVSDTTEL
jgi:hypothetical protein